MFFFFLFTIEVGICSVFFFSGRRRHTRWNCDWSSDVCSSDLEEAVAEARSSAAGTAAPAAEEWTPQITIGTSVLIPDSYVADLGVRLGLYRRIATLLDQREIDAFAAELVDRFGPLPQEVGNLLEIIAIKRLCRDAGIEKVDAGPKGAVFTFRDNRL